MSTAKPKPQAETETDERRQPPRREPQAEAAPDWQILLLRYLPEPRGAHHVIKRFASR